MGNAKHMKVNSNDVKLKGQGQGQGMGRQAGGGGNAQDIRGSVDMNMGGAMPDPNGVDFGNGGGGGGGGARKPLQFGHTLDDLKGNMNTDNLRSMSERLQKLNQNYGNAAKQMNIADMNSQDGT